MGLFDKLKQVAGNYVHNAETNITGLYHQVNPFDGGQTLATTRNAAATAAQHRADVTNQFAQAHWTGAPGGDQELFVPPLYHGVESTPRLGPVFQPPAGNTNNYSGNPMIASPLYQMLAALRVGTNSGPQPSTNVPEDDTPQVQLLQPQPYNTGQVSLNGQFLQGSLPFGTNPYTRLR